MFHFKTSFLTISTPLARCYIVLRFSPLQNLANNYFNWSNLQGKSATKTAFPDWFSWPRMVAPCSTTIESVENSCVGLSCLCVCHLFQRTRTQDAVWEKKGMGATDNLERWLLSTLHYFIGMVDSSVAMGWKQPRSLLSFLSKTTGALPKAASHAKPKVWWTHHWGSPSQV